MSDIPDYTFNPTIPTTISNKLELTMSNIDQTLQERGNNYGKFTEHARITQNIKQAMQDSPNWGKLPPHMKEAMEMTAHKYGRILNGNFNLHDSWHDTVGYNKLVADTLIGTDK